MLASRLSARCVERCAVVDRDVAGPHIDDFAPASTRQYHRQDDRAIAGADVAISGRTSATIEALREKYVQLQEDNFDLHDAYLELVDEVQILRMNSANSVSTPPLPELLANAGNQDRGQFFDTLDEESRAT